MEAEYNIQISWCEPEDGHEGGFTINMYANDGDGTPIAENYGVPEYDHVSLQDMFYDICEELNISLADVEIIRDY